jgi:DNA-binding protein Fis
MNALFVTGCTKFGHKKMENSAKNGIDLRLLLNKLDDTFINAKIGAIYKIVVEAVEKPLIEKALARTFGNQFKAAKILGISRSTLRTKITKFGIRAEKWKI